MTATLTCQENTLAQPRKRPVRDPEFGERFVLAMALAGLKPSQLAREEGVIAGTVSAWRNGERPDDLRLPRLATRLGVSLRWLKTGEGAREGGPSEGAASTGYATPQLAPAPPLLIEEPSLRGGVGDTRREAAGDATRVAGYLVMKRIAGRTFVPAAEVITYLAAVADAAGGHAVMLPPGPETVAPLEPVPPLAKG